MPHLTLLVLLQTSLLAGPVTPGTAPLRYQDAYQRAKRSGQPLLILVGADWCGACRSMKTSVLPELGRRGTLRRITFATVDQDREKKLAAKLMVGSTVPQLILFTKTEDGWHRRQLTGVHSVHEVQSFLHRSITATAGRPPRTIPR